MLRAHCDPPQPWTMDILMYERKTYLKYQIFQTRALEVENINCRKSTESAMHIKTGQASNINIICLLALG